MNMRAVAREIAPGLTQLIRLDSGVTVWMATRTPEVLFTYDEQHARRWLAAPPSHPKA
jgi:hypothetical protein